MDILLIPNLSKKNGYECTCEVIRRMSGYGCSCWMMEESMHGFAGQPVKSFPPQGQKIDMIFSIGGDGTLIHSARHAVEMDCPVLGINAGRLGFLTEIEYNALDRLEQIVQGNYSIQQRMMLHASAIKQNGRQEFSALNDVVITKGAFGKMVDIDVEMKNGFVNNYRADGLIFSTPTGSTAYSLSAGGPIIYSSIECISVTAICPHSLASRAILYSPEEVFTVRGRYVNNSEILYMSVDGENRVRIEPTDCVVISKDSRYVKYVNFGSKHYFEKLNKKIMGR